MGGARLHTVLPQYSSTSQISIMYIFIEILLVMCGVWAAFQVAYLLLLACAALLAPRATPGIEAAPRSRFLLLIPAHNEERLLPSLFLSLGELQYPTEQYHVDVVADN